VSLPRGKVPGLVAQWFIAKSILTLTVDAPAFFFRENVRLVKPPTEKLLCFSLRPEVPTNEDDLLIRLDGSEEWDDTADVLGLDCKLRAGAFLTLRAFPLANFEVDDAIPVQ